MEKRVQIAFDVDSELRAQIKIVAAKRNISMNLWLIRAIVTALSKEMDVVGATPTKRRKDW